MATELYKGWYVDANTARPAKDLSRKYFVALRRVELARLRSILKRACFVFEQKYIYLSVAGQGVRREARR